MKSKYGSNYSGLRLDLGVPHVFDFAIISENLTSATMEMESIPDSVEIIAQDYIAAVLKKDGSIINERFTFKIW